MSENLRLKNPAIMRLTIRNLLNNVIKIQKDFDEWGQVSQSNLDIIRHNLELLTIGNNQIIQDKTGE